MKKALLLMTALITVTFADAYLSQEIIDSTVQEAYYGFVAATREAGGLYTQKSAIMNAQQTVAKLKKLAEDDPNKRYILWRVSELEQQIYLEQEELRLKHEFERVTEINRLVEIFNTELFLPRPSFGKLHMLHNKVGMLSVEHANQFATNINQKNRVIIAELNNEMRDAFITNDYDEAEKIYKYAVKNKKYLKLNEKQYDQWSTQIQAKRNADYLTKNIDKQVRQVRTIVSKNKIAEARRHVEVIQLEVEGAARHLSSSFVNKTRSDLSSISRSITVREDSLVSYNMSLINMKSDKATYYMDSVLRPAGVSPEKIAAVDRAILKASGNKKKVNKKVNAEIAFIEQSTSQTGLSMDDISASVKLKADSLKRHYQQLQIDVREHYIQTHKSEFKQLAKTQSVATKNQVKADKVLYKIDAAVQKGDFSKADQMFTKKEQLLLSHATPDLYIDIRREMNRGLGRSTFGDRQIAAVTARQKESSPDRLQEQAVEITTKIYNALDKRDVESAAGYFYRNEELLEKNTYADAFYTMKKTIVKEYNRKYMK